MTISQPPTRRAPLTSRQRTGALLAGGFGFTLIATALDAIVMAIVLVLLVALLSFLFGAFVGGFPPQASSELTGAFFGSVGLVFWPIAIAVLVGVILFLLAGFVISPIVLRRTGSPRGAAITWSAFGIGIVAHGILDIVLFSVVSGIEGSSSGDGGI